MLSPVWPDCGTYKLHSLCPFLRIYNYIKMNNEWYRRGSLLLCWYRAISYYNLNCRCASVHAHFFESIYKHSNVHLSERERERERVVLSCFLCYCLYCVFVPFAMPLYHFYWCYLNRHALPPIQSPYLTVLTYRKCQTWRLISICHLVIECMHGSQVWTRIGVQCEPRAWDLSDLQNILY